MKILIKFFTLLTFLIGYVEFAKSDNELYCAEFYPDDRCDIYSDSSGNLYRNDTGDVWGDGNYNNGLLRNIDTGEELHCDYHGNCFYE